MSVLVTGGAGYIGSHTVLALREAGEEVVVLDSFATGFRAAVPQGVPVIEGDVGDAATLAALFADHAIDAVIHFAASTVIPDSVADPLGYYGNNTVAARTLIAGALAAGVRHVVFSSTAAVYGEVGHELVREDHPTRPVSPYGRSKLMVEWMLQDAARAHDLSFAALRYFNVAGADPLGRIGQSTRGATHLIKVAAEAAAGRRDGLTIFGTDLPTADGTGVRDFIAVSDLAHAHVLALSHLRAGGKSVTLNCGYGRGTSVRQVIDTMRRVSGRDFKVIEAAPRPGEIAQVVASNAAILATLPWHPRFDDLEAICRQAYDWERRVAQGVA